MHKYAWGMSAVFLGVWEATAFTTGRVPTISSTVWLCRSRRQRATSIAVTFWLLSLRRHLLSPPRP